MWTDIRHTSLVRLLQRTEASSQLINLRAPRICTFLNRLKDISVGCFYGLGWNLLIQLSCLSLCRLARFVSVKLRKQVLGIEDSSQVQQKAIVLNPADNRRVGAAKPFTDSVGVERLMNNRDHYGWKLFGG